MSILRTFDATPFESLSMVDLVDTFVSDGSTLAYTVTKKTGLRIGSTIQAGSLQYTREGQLNQFTVSGDTFTLSSAPPVGTIIIVPGIRKVQIRAYDQATVEGDPTPRIHQAAFYVAPQDPLDIIKFKYIEQPANPGIKLQMVDLDSLNGAALSWLSIAPALADGSPGTFQAATLPLYFDPIQNEDTFFAAVSPSDTTITVTDGTLFEAGRYIILEPNTVRQEQVKILSILGDVLTVTPTAYSHAIGEPLYDFGLKFWLETLIPLNASSGTPVNLNDVIPQIIGSVESRI